MAQKSFTTAVVGPDGAELSYKQAKALEASRRQEKRSPSQDPDRGAGAFFLSQGNIPKI